MITSDNNQHMGGLNDAWGKPSGSYSQINIGPNSRSFPAADSAGFDPRDIYRNVQSMRKNSLGEMTLSDLSKKLGYVMAGVGVFIAIMWARAAITGQLNDEEEAIPSFGL